MTASWRRALLAAGLAAGAVPLPAQTLDYVEPGAAGCPAVPAATAPRTVRVGVAVTGRLRVACGLGQGSYTVTLAATDPEATFTPRSFIVNFGRLVGRGDFTVTFSTVGVHGLSARITSNMGSPAVAGGFVSADSEFRVVAP